MIKKSFFIILTLISLNQLQAADHSKVDQETAHAIIVSNLIDSGLDDRDRAVQDLIAQIELVLGFNQTGYDLYGNQLMFDIALLERAVSSAITESATETSNFATRSPYGAPVTASAADSTSFSRDRDLKICPTCTYQNSATNNNCEICNAELTQPSTSYTWPTEEVFAAHSYSPPSPSTDEANDSSIESDQLDTEQALLFFESWLQANISHDQYQEYNDAILKKLKFLPVFNATSASPAYIDQKALELALQNALKEIEADYWSTKEVNLTNKINKSNADDLLNNFIKNPFFKDTYPGLTIEDFDLDDILLKAKVPTYDLNKSLDQKQYYEDKLNYLIKQAAQQILEIKVNGKIEICRKCKHIVCATCAQKLPKHSCPVCKHPQLDILKQSDLVVDHECQICQEEISLPQDHAIIERLTTQVEVSPLEQMRQTMRKK